jgi:hypothetical protein
MVMCSIMVMKKKKKKKQMLIILHYTDMDVYRYKLLEKKPWKVYFVGKKLKSWNVIFFFFFQTIFYLRDKH